MSTQASDLTLQQRALFQQGYQRYSPEELKQLNWGLRFTPAVCTTLSIIGLVTQTPWLLLLVASMGVAAFFFPGHHPMDLLYNHLVRHAFGAVRLPPNPLQRRLACLSAAIVNIAAAALLLVGWTMAAWVAGGLLVILQTIVITTHFCVLSWAYELAMRALGRWQTALSADAVHSKVAGGAVLIDVRSQGEYEREHLAGAVNIPVDELEARQDQIPQAPMVVYCASGMRSHIAMEKLNAMRLGQPVFQGGGIKALKARFETRTGDASGSEASVDLEQGSTAKAG